MANFKTSLLTLLAGLAAVSCAAGEPPAATASSSNFLDPAEGETSVVLLGTGGGPQLSAERAGIATLITVRGRNYLVDAGEGVSRQLVSAGVDTANVPVVFLTHLHDDHTAGLPSLLTLAYTNRARQVAVIGPPRTEALTDAIVSSLQPNAEIRRSENNLDLLPQDVISATVVEPGVIFTDENIRATAVENTHYTDRGRIPADPVARRNRSFSYRFETPDRVVVFTGDTGPSEAVRELADGADILVAEMITEGDLVQVPEAVRPIVRLGHLTPLQVGELANQARVKTLVLSHIGTVSPDDVAQIRSMFAGRVVVGADLSRF